MSTKMILLVTIAYVCAMIWFTINFPWVVVGSIAFLFALMKIAPYDHQLWDQETIRKFT